MNQLQLSELYIYPIKSLGGIRLDEANVTPRGLKYDRRWMLVDENNRFMTQREHHEMALLQVSIEAGCLKIHHKTKTLAPLFIQLEANPYNAQTVVIWDDEVTAVEVSKEADEWFSEALNFGCRLVYMPDDSKRLVDVNYAINQDITSFSDAYPFLIIGQSSLDDLNTRLDEPVLMNRFRPNLVFTGGQPYEEDTWNEFWVGTNQFFGVKPCARCVLTTIDQEIATQGKEPLRTLTSYRKQGSKVLFGQNLLTVTLGTVRVGDTIEIMSRK